MFSSVPKHAGAVLLLLQFVSFSHAEQPTPDLALTRLQARDTNAVLHLQELARKQAKLSELVAARSHATQALSLADSLDYYRGMGFSHRVLANIAKQEGKRSEELNHRILALQFFDLIGDSLEAANSKRLTGTLYLQLNQVDMAQNYFAGANRMFTSLRHKRGIAQTLSDLGQVSYFREKYNESARYHLRAIALADSTNDEEIKATALGRLSHTYRAAHKLQMALDVLKQELAIVTRLNDKFLTADALGDLGIAYTDIERYDEAILFLNKSIRTHKELQATEALPYLYHSLARAYAGKGDYKQAFAMEGRAHELGAKVSSKQQQEEIAIKQAEYDVEVRELQNQHLQEENTQQRRMTIMLSLAGATIIILLLFAYGSKRKANRALSEKNALISRQTSELRQSVEELERAKIALHTTNEKLQKGIEARMQELVAVNDQLRKEIEERKHLEQQLLQAQKLESLGTLAGGIAHDFNNILGIILAHASMLEAQRDQPSLFAKRSDAILKATNRGAGLVRQLLTFARKTEPASDSINVNEIILELKALLAETFPRTISLQLDLAENIPFVSADRTQIHQTLLNLCVNSRDAMPRGGTLALRTGLLSGDAVRTLLPAATAHQYVCVTVSDTGFGMDEQTRQRIFEPFFSTKSVGRGTGLGLAVAYGVMTSHNGFIDVQSEVGKGTTFFLYFPCPELRIAEKPPVNHAPVEVHGGTETILIIEDEEALRHMLSVILSERGYRILEAEDGASAIGIVSASPREHIDLILSDIGLPKIDGWEAYKTIRTYLPGAKIIFASGFFDPEIRGEMLKQGISHFIQKPYRPIEILQKVREALDEVKALSTL